MKKIRLMKNMNNNGYMILIGVIVFGAIILTLNWAVYDNFKDIDDFEEYTEDVKANEEEISFWEDPLGWIGQGISNTIGGIVTVITLDVPLVNDLGFLGGMLQLVFVLFLTVGVIDILWIG